MNRRSTTYSIISHLRFPFSFLLLPVFLFAVSQTKEASTMEIVYLFLIWHVLVYPSSNAYNSTQDRDEGPIGGLENPPKVPKSLEKISLAFDVLAVLLSFAAFGYTMAILVMAYIVVSRLYSNRSIRLKKISLVGCCHHFYFSGCLGVCHHLICSTGRMEHSKQYLGRASRWFSGGCRIPNITDLST
jgi:hypothetical protein